MGIVDQNTTNRREAGTRKYVNIILASLGAGVPFIGFLVGFGVHFNVIVSVFHKSSTIAKDLLFPVLSGAPFFFIYSIVFFDPWPALTSPLSGTQAIVTLFVVSSVSVAASMLYAYGNKFWDNE